MKSFNIRTAILVMTVMTSWATAWALRREPLPFGDMNQWVTRNIHESAIIGGETKKVYEIGPNATLDGNHSYRPQGGTPWATSNVYARVHGINKASNAVYPAIRTGSDRCARLATELQSVKVLGVVNMDVMVAGSIFLGRMLEPITGTGQPYKKMDMGIPYTKRPEALVFDYKVEIPSNNTRIRASGFGKKKTLPGHDRPVVFVLLQRRWEEPDGSLHAKRVASASETFDHSTPWVNGHELKLHYGDITGTPAYHASTLGLRQGDKAYYAKNSQGKMVPVIEEGWDTPDAVPTHAIVMMSAASGEPFVGTPGLTFYVDNVGFGF